jgi:ATP-dependent protease Clp ATPase subunit
VPRMRRNRMDVLMAEREARIREVAELRAQKDAWIARLEVENERLQAVAAGELTDKAEVERLRQALEKIADQTFLDAPEEARRQAASGDVMSSSATIPSTRPARLDMP